MRNHSALAQQSNAVISAVQNMNYNQIHDLYGIDIEPTGTVTDTAYNMKFASLGEWVDWCVANDEYEEKQFIKHNHYDILS